MIILSGKIKLVLSAIIVLGTTLLVLVNYTDACRLKTVTLNNNRVNDWQNRFGLNDSNTILEQPLNRVAKSLINEKAVFKVDISFSLPNGIEIKTNNFKPACFLLDKKTGQLLGLNKNARVISLMNSDLDWEHPVLTSTTAGDLFDYCDDVRVAVVVRQLEQVKNENIDLYRLLDEIDFSHRELLQVSISGLPYRLKLRAEHFFEDLNKFVEFVSRFSPNLEEVTFLDLRYDNMIICASRKG